MKSEHLRLNNIVKVHWEDEHRWCDLDFWEGIEFEPFPLTEEWLERFGFEKIQMSIPTAYKTKDGFRIKKDQRGYWMQYKYGMTIIKHVHQLQNLYFALTGEELQTDETEQKVNL